MNVFRSGEEMLRWTILFGRFSTVWKPHSLIPQTIFGSRNCSVPSLWSRRTLQEHTWSHNVKYFCQGKSYKPQYDEHVDSSPSSQAVAVVSRSQGDGGKTRKEVHKKLQECLSPSDVLDLMDTSTLSHMHISNSLTRMWETTKMMSDEQRRCELSLMMEHPGFQELCYRARVDAPRMLNDDLVFSLLAMIKLGVSQSSFVVQTLLRVVQERLNQFEEKSLSILSKCLEEMESSKNVEALKEGLKLVLEDRIPTIQNVVLLQAVMRLLGKDAPPATKRKLEMKALSMVDEFSLPNTQYMMSTMATMDLNSKPLLNMCINKITENLHNVRFTHLLMVLKSCHELHYRKYNFFSSISDYLTSTMSMWSNKQVIFVLLEFEGLGFCPVTLMDAFAERVIRKPESLIRKDIFSVLKVYSSLNPNLKENHQAFLDSITHVLESYLTKLSSADLLKAASYFCLLNHFPQTLLEKLLQKGHLDKLLPEGRPLHKFVEMNLHTLSLCLRLDKPPLPPTVSPIPDFHSSMYPHELPVNPVLVRALKSLFGENAVVDSVVEEGVYFIDCVITLSAESKGICHSTEEGSETLQKPLRIAVLSVPMSMLCFGTSQPRSKLALKIRHLKLLGYKPVLVPVYLLKTQTDEETISVLKNLFFPN